MENSEHSSQLVTPWSSSEQELIEKLNVDPEVGLAEIEVKQRQNKFGYNQLQIEKEKSIFDIAVNQFKSLIIILLAVSAVISFIFGDFIEGIAIIVVILINAAIGFLTELRAVRSMEALRELTRVTAKVKREEHVLEINAREIVPGDILVINSGDVITADARLIQASKLEINEASLTGESLPVKKQTESLPEDVVLADRKNMVYKGTSVASGSGQGIVVTTGMETELGNISSLVQESEEEITPLENRLDSLGRKLIYVTLGLVTLVAISGWATGGDLYLMIETAIALAVASIPEGLPIVATIALARGMKNMAEKNALINKLSSVETLGATSVIITDKTGTLTENQMTVTDILLEDGAVKVHGEGLDIDGDFEWVNSKNDETETNILEKLLKVGVLCNDASLTNNDGQISETIGEPMEIALQIAGYKTGITKESLKDDLPEVRKIAFEQSTKMMATVHEYGKDRYLYAVKGSPEAVFESSSYIAAKGENREYSEKVKEKWLKRSEDLADRGLRIIAIAMKELPQKDKDPYHKLTLLGLVGLMDPPREEVRAAIERCKSAGIKVIMATGDHGVTAREVAKAVNLVESDEVNFLLGKDLKDIEALSDQERERYLKTKIFARVNPEQKLSLIELNQNHGEIVAMTGDGVNDAPALKKADIGVAMGDRGTQVAKEAADMVLQDDFFGTIVAAVEQGRAIFNNIRKFILYLLSCNISEIMVVTIASVINLPLPILPLQILFLNLVTDVFPALALGMGEGDPYLMQESPRDSKEPIMTKHHWVSMTVYGSLITAAVLIGMHFAFNVIGFDKARSTTISFLILALAQLWHVFDMRTNGTGILSNAVTKNKYVWLALALSSVIILAAIYIPFLADILSLRNPGWRGWVIVVVASFAPMLVSQLLKELDLVV
jgi:P-type Ca2+ transporter type 2C